MLVSDTAAYPVASVPMTTSVVEQPYLSPVTTVMPTVAPAPVTYVPQVYPEVAPLPQEVAPLGSRIPLETQYLSMGARPLYRPAVPTYAPLVGQSALVGVGGAGVGVGANTANYATYVQVLRNAVVGLGTDEQAIINVIAHTNASERAIIRNMYTQTYGENLIKRLEGETSSDFQKCVVGAFMTPTEYDAYCLYCAMKGLGTNEGVLSEIIGSRTPYELALIKQNYQMNYGESLERAIEGDTSGDYRNLLLACLACRRSMSPTPDAAGCQVDAAALYNAGEGRWGTDEATFTRIFATRSPADLVLINQYYRAQTGKGLLGAIDSEFSGDTKELLDTIVRAQVDPPGYYADRIHESVAGVGTNDSRLIRNILSRSDKDMPAIMQAYRQKYGTDMVADVNSDTSGDYRRVLNAILLGYSGNTAAANYGLAGPTGVASPLVGSTLATPGLGYGTGLATPLVGSTLGTPLVGSTLGTPLVGSTLATPTLGYGTGLASPLVGSTLATPALGYGTGLATPALGYGNGLGYPISGRLSAPLIGGYGPTYGALGTPGTLGYGTGLGTYRGSLGGIY